MRLSDLDFMDIVNELVDEHFPKNKCKERGAAIVLVARLRMKLIEKKVMKNGHTSF